MWFSIGSLLQNKTPSFKEKVEDASLPKEYRKAFEEIYPGAAPYVKYKDFRNNTLYLTVSDPVWISELDSKKNEVKESINKNRKNPISGIRFTLE